MTNMTNEETRHFVRDMLARNLGRSPTDEEVERAVKSVVCNLQPMSILQANEFPAETRREDAMRET